MLFLIAEIHLLGNDSLEPKDQIVGHDLVKPTEPKHVISLLQNQDKNEFKKPTKLVQHVTSLEKKTKPPKILSVTSLETPDYFFFEDEEDLSAERVSDINQRFDKKEMNDNEKTKFKPRQKHKKEVANNKKQQENDIERKLKEKKKKAERRKLKKKEKENKNKNMSVDKIKYLKLFEEAKSDKMIEEKNQHLVSISTTFHKQLLPIYMWGHP